MSSTLDDRPSIDGRIAARRQTVREAGARRRLRWLLLLLGLAGGGALVSWLLFQSSLLAVSDITVTGQARSAATAIIDDVGVMVGMPTINVPDEELEVAIAADPWVAGVDVTVRWPGTVEVTVIEHVPAAWVRTGDDWALVAHGGAVLEVAASIPEDAPRIDVGVVEAMVGGSLTSLESLAAIEFLNLLPAELLPGAAVSGDASELRAVVAGFETELGYPSAMEEKAAAVIALIEADLVPSGAVISVVSPDRPAVLRTKARGAKQGGNAGATATSGQDDAVGNGGDGD